MGNYKLTEDAKEDLRYIYRYGVKEFGEAQADLYYDALFRLVPKLQFGNLCFSSSCLQCPEAGASKTGFPSRSFKAINLSIILILIRLLGFLSLDDVKTEHFQGGWVDKPLFLHQKIMAKTASVPTQIRLFVIVNQLDAS